MKHPKGLILRKGIWYITFMYNGRRIRISTQTNDLPLAKKIHDKVRGEVVSGKWFPEPLSLRKTFKDLVDKFRSYIPERSRSTYESYIKDFSKFFKDRPLSSITLKTVDEYKIWRKEKGGGNSIHVRLVILKRIFNLAAEWEWFGVNGISPLAKFRNTEKQRIRIRWMSQEEEDRILHNSPEWFQEIILFAVNTGMRIGEIVNLTWKDIDLFRKAVVILYSKSGQPRTIPLNAKVYEMLLRKSKIRSIASDKVFPFTKAQIQNFWVATCKGLRIENLHFHDIRHTFATRLIQSGVDTYAVQLLLGHSTPTMTQRYAHHNIESLRSAVEIVATKVAQ